MILTRLVLLLASRIALMATPLGLDAARWLIGIFGLSKEDSFAKQIHNPISPAEAFGRGRTLTARLLLVAKNHPTEDAFGSATKLTSSRDTPTGVSVTTYTAALWGHPVSF